MVFHHLPANQTIGQLRGGGGGGGGGGSGLSLKLPFLKTPFYLSVIDQKAYSY